MYSHCGYQLGLNREKKRRGPYRTCFSEKITLAFLEFLIKTIQDRDLVFFLSNYKWQKVIMFCNNRNRKMLKVQHQDTQCLIGALMTSEIWMIIKKNTSVFFIVMPSKTFRNPLKINSFCLHRHKKMWLGGAKKGSKKAQW